MKFIVYAETSVLGLRKESTFEIDDEVFKDMTAEDRTSYIQREAVDAAFDAGLVDIGFEEVTQ